jgi:hypothetical protein
VLCFWDKLINNDEKVLRSEKVVFVGIHLRNADESRGLVRCLSAKYCANHRRGMKNFSQTIAAAEKERKFSSVSNADKQFLMKM